MISRSDLYKDAARVQYVVSGSTAIFHISYELSVSDIEKGVLAWILLLIINALRQRYEVVSRNVAHVQVW